MRLALPCLVSLLVLGGCTALEYQAGDSFERTRQLAEAGDPSAQLDLARMYAAPDRFPQTRGTAPDPTKAAEWCFIASAGPAPRADIAARGPSCVEILRTIPARQASVGQTMAQAWLLGPQDYIER
ncbi:conserved exported protein of unknown function [Rhodovastum atsumiense]|uniref:Sel1 repeat family protein n=1 Tax=Rhodovastum atsumiense TaxID=504468 RepID=A0A5M6ISX2_9PROT|nr:hypothetical protein [Rhodovastum atsumiense]KAA5611352.1 hypothetical protein F1189_14520 [Rhodovastum atsumiense]CAH2603659.1 conserved exported protein of unknown function [Rhodovastum atsumiense]